MYCICIMTRGGIYGEILSTREIPRAEPEGFPEGSGSTSPYNRDILNLKKLYFQYCPSW